MKIYIKLIHELEGECTINLNYTINPLNNSLEELIKVKSFCDQHNLHLAVGVYNTPEFLNPQMEKEKTIDITGKGIRGYPIDKFIRLYNDWLEGKIYLPCLSIRHTCVVLPNGDVSLCQGRNIIVGSLNKSTIDEIWNSKHTHNLQNRYLDCNRCWMLCHRPIDIVVSDILKFIPKFLLPKKLLPKFKT